MNKLFPEPWMAHCVVVYITGLLSIFNRKQINFVLKKSCKNYTETELNEIAEKLRKTGVALTWTNAFILLPLAALIEEFFFRLVPFFVAIICTGMIFGLYIEPGSMEIELTTSLEIGTFFIFLMSIGYCAQLFFVLAHKREPELVKIGANKILFRGGAIAFLLFYITWLLLGPWWALFYCSAGHYIWNISALWKRLLDKWIRETEDH